MKLKYIKKFKTLETGNLPKFKLKKDYDVIVSENINDIDTIVCVKDESDCLVKFNLNSKLGLCFKLIE